MKITNILKNAYELFHGAILTHWIGSILMFSVIYFLYVWLMPIIFERPLTELFSLLSSPEELNALLASGSFQIKLMLFVLLIDGMITPFSAGCYQNFDGVTKNKFPTFVNVLAHYRSSYTAALLQYVFLMFALRSLLGGVLGLLGFPTLNVALSLFLSVVFSLTIPILIIEHKSLLEAMRNSYERVMHSFFPIFICLLIGGLITLLGFFVAGLPVMYAIIFSIYVETKKLKTN